MDTRTMIKKELERIGSQNADSILDRYAAEGASALTISERQILRRAFLALSSSIILTDPDLGGQDIPDDEPEGWECEDCGHVFFVASASSIEDGGEIIPSWKESI